jgi:four helix bundle protein
MRRAVISIASNIAEGAARQTKKEFAQFLHNAQGSLSELDTQNIIAKRLGYLSEDVFKKVEIELDSEDRMLTGLIKSLRRNIKE